MKSNRLDTYHHGAVKAEKELRGQMLGSTWRGGLLALLTNENVLISIHDYLVEGLVVELNIVGCRWRLNAALQSSLLGDATKVMNASCQVAITIAELNHTHNSTRLSRSRLPS